jgi:methylmalonyl-CoA/ethylmalonyl-CoA epimerase
MIYLPDFAELPLRFHHIGMACDNLDKETKHLISLGYQVEDNDFTDPIQGIHGRFLSGQFPRLELLVPATSEESVLTPYLNNKIKMYHLAYETSELEQSIQHLVSHRAKIIVKPIPAVAFQGRHIAFLMLPNMLLIELINTIHLPTSL